MRERQGRRKNKDEYPVEIREIRRLAEQFLKK